MNRAPLPADSKSYTDLAFREKRKLRRRRARMSLTQKFEVLDRLLEMRKQIPRVVMKPTAGSRC